MPRMGSAFVARLPETNGRDLTRHAAAENRTQLVVHPRAVSSIRDYRSLRSENLLRDPDRAGEIHVHCIGPTDSHRLVRRCEHIARLRWGHGVTDRKSTRLNSSHSQISYAVFCLKKKN